MKSLKNINFKNLINAKKINERTSETLLPYTGDSVCAYSGFASLDESKKYINLYFDMVKSNTSLR